MAGTQVLEWVNLDTEIKTAGLKDVSGVPFPQWPVHWPSRIGHPCSSRSVCAILFVEEIAYLSSIRHAGWSTLTCAIIGGPVMLIHRSATIQFSWWPHQLIASSTRTFRLHMSLSHHNVRKKLLCFETLRVLIHALDVDRFPYTMDTYNNPQNVWAFVWVSKTPLLHI